MKPIRGMSLLELAEYVNNNLGSGDDINDIIYRLCELHDLTRWIPVSERMPTKADANEQGYVCTYNKGRTGICFLGENGHPKVWHSYHQDWVHFDGQLTHWQRITPPTKEATP